jgi:hypothetical protein
MPSRFDYVRYDDHAVTCQNHFKEQCARLEHNIEALGRSLPPMKGDEALKQLASLGRSRSMALTKLEELYMWIGKALRDEQILRNGSAPLQEERNDG